MTSRFLSQSATSNEAAKKPFLRLMPLGASITWGQLSTDGNGYRNDLRNLLINSGGYGVNMVGANRHGTMANNENDGWPGEKVNEVLDKHARTDVPKYLPNLITLNAGTNDAKDDYDIPNIHKRMNDMLEFLWSASPGTTVIFSSLIVNANKTNEARILDINKQYKTLADQKIAAGRRIVYVDMQGPDGPQLSDLADDTHPNDKGYDKMAKIWYRGIQEASGKGFIQPPHPMPSN